MTSLTNAFNYCSLATRKAFKHPSVRQAYLVFLLKGVLAGGIALLLIVACLVWLQEKFIGDFLIGIILALLLFCLLYQAVFLQTRVIGAYASDSDGFSADPPDSKSFNREVFRYVLTYPWLSKTPTVIPDDSQATLSPLSVPKWKRGKHLLLPIMTLRTGQLDQAQTDLENQTLLNPLRIDPGRVKVGLLAWLLPLIFGSLGAWLGLLAANHLTAGLPFTLPNQILSVALAMLIFLALLLPTLGLSSIWSGYYCFELYQSENQPSGTEAASPTGLLGEILSKQGA
ncbi:MAG: hypothetical protein WA116_03670 [Anaerolineaceae bacterium]